MRALEEMRPVVNVEETIGKTVGRRGPPNPFSLLGGNKGRYACLAAGVSYRIRSEGSLPVSLPRRSRQMDAKDDRASRETGSGELEPRTPGLEDLIEL